MRFTKRLFPHPVLNYYSDDYNQFSFQAIPTLETRSYQLQCRVKFMIVEPELLALIKNGFAKYVIHAECPYTRHRTVIKTTDKTVEFEVALGDVVDRLELSFFILSTRDFENFRSDNFHSDYGEALFSIREGNILAVAISYSFELVDPVDKLKPVSSILKIEKNTTENPPSMMFDPTDHKLRVLLSPSVYALYAQLRDKVSNVIHAAIVVPALVDAIEWSRRGVNDKHEFEELRWYRHLARRAAELDLCLSDNEIPAIEIVQEVLSDPVWRCLHEVSEYIEFEE